MITDNIIYLQSISDIAAEIPVDGGKILITGATGLIGSCIIDVLMEANRSFRKNFTVYAMGRSIEKLKRRFAAYESVRYLVQDVVQSITTDSFDYVIHAASNADPRSYALYPVETILTNIIGAQNILDHCKEHGTRVLLTSSFEVYGKLNKDVYTEKDYGIVDLDLIRSCYPESKRTAESLFKAYHDEYGVDCVIARLSSIYGPTMQNDDSKAHAQFLRNALAGEDIVLKSMGTQKRTYSYVMDAVNGLFTVLFKGVSGEAYNVANADSIATIAEVAHAIAVIAGTKVRFELPDDVEYKGFSRPQNCVLDTEKLRMLGWTGKYDLEHGLRDTLEILHNM